MSRSSFRSLPFFVLGALAGCATTASSAPTSSSTSPAPATFAEQVALGQSVYGQSCASCHGASGEGGKAPRLVGLKEGALPLDPPATRQFRKAPFVTVADVAIFAVQYMPPKKAGTLTGDQYWAVVAFDLHANGIDLPATLTPAQAATLTIPR